MNLILLISEMGFLNYIHSLGIRDYFVKKSTVDSYNSLVRLLREKSVSFGVPLGAGDPVEMNSKDFTYSCRRKFRLAFGNPDHDRFLGEAVDLFEKLDSEEIKKISVLIGSSSGDAEKFVKEWKPTSESLADAGSFADMGIFASFLVVSNACFEKASWANGQLGRQFFITNYNTDKALKDFSSKIVKRYGKQPFAGRSEGTSVVDQDLHRLVPDVSSAELKQRMHKSLAQVVEEYGEDAVTVIDMFDPEKAEKKGNSSVLNSIMAMWFPLPVGQRHIYDSRMSPGKVPKEISSELYGNYELSMKREPDEVIEAAIEARIRDERTSEVWRVWKQQLNLSADFSKEDQEVISRLLEGALEQRGSTSSLLKKNPDYAERIRAISQSPVYSRQDFERFSADLGYIKDTSRKSNLIWSSKALNLFSTSFMRFQNYVSLEEDVVGEGRPQSVEPKKKEDVIVEALWGAVSKGLAEMLQWNLQEIRARFAASNVENPVRNRAEAEARATSANFTRGYYASSGITGGVINPNSSFGKNLNYLADECIKSLELFMQEQLGEGVEEFKREFNPSF